MVFLQAIYTTNEGEILRGLIVAFLPDQECVFVEGSSGKIYYESIKCFQIEIE